jgi:uncharacterized protein (TIGR02270 family)
MTTGTVNDDGKDAGTDPGRARTGSIRVVVEQHVDDAGVIHALRTRLAAAPHVQLHHLRRFDDRLAAHLDGLSVAGDEAWPLCREALERPVSSAAFVAATQVLERKPDRLDWLLELTEAVPAARPGLISAFGWAEPDHLQGTVASLLGARSPYRRLVGLAACSLHRVDPGISSGPWIRDADPSVQARAFRLAGEVARTELESVCVGGLTNRSPDGRLWGAWSAVLLGSRGAALQTLVAAGQSAGLGRAMAFRFSLQAMAIRDARELLRRMAADAKNLSRIVEGSGVAGDPTYVPWLIGHMSSDQTARLAGEAFSLITGADVALLDLERKPPEDFEPGPSDDPNDLDVEMDPDDGLPWPDPHKTKDWWAQNSSRFTPGQRYFMGKPVTWEHCIDVLKHGYQRQRILAAHYLCLLRPGTPLFNTSAPAWRQQRLLAEMT